MISTVEYRRLRGLAIHFWRRWPDIRRSREFSRALFGTFGPIQKGAARGRCRWCGLPTETGRKVWHKECVDAYRAATGQSVTYLWPYYSRPACPCGADGVELDHRDALVLAWESRDPRRIVRASSLANLVWLCSECHREKTRRDMQELSAIRSAQVCLMGLIPSDDERLGVDYWIVAEGGRAGYLDVEGGRLIASKSGIRRGPVTWRPERVTCPSCLVAMEDPRPESWKLHLPAGWHLDDKMLPLEDASIRSLTPRRIREQSHYGQQKHAGQLEFAI